MDDLLELKSYHALNVAYRSDHKRLKELFHRYRSWKNAYEASIPSLDVDREAEWRKLEKARLTLIVSSARMFPPMLREIPWPPFGLYVKGQLPRDEMGPAVAIVGTRKATRKGKEIAYQFSKRLAEAGCTIMSGLAIGIDAVAHEGALDAHGRTVAVLGNGLPAIYPKENEKLGERIVEAGGALVTEYPPGTPSLPRHFIERNRLVSGLARGVVIVEAPEQSGALATARFALEQNREVWVIPGPISEANYHGSHTLIKSGAMLVTSPDDVLELFPELAEQARKNSAVKFGDFSPHEQAVLDILTSLGEAVSIDKIQELSRMDITQINRSIASLVVKGILEEEGGRCYLKRSGGSVV